MSISPLMSRCWSRAGWPEAVAIGLAVLLAAAAYVSERMFEAVSIARVGIVIALYVSLSGAVWMATRRLAASAFAAFALLATLGALSKAKFDYIGATLHVLDLYIHLGSPVEVAFFAVHQPAAAMLGIAAIGMLALVTVRLWRRETPRPWPRLAAVPVVLLPFAAASHYAASPRLQEQMLHGHFYDGYHLTSWFLSAFRPIDNAALAARFPGTAAKVASALAHQPTPEPAKAPKTKPPNIILILHESTIDPRPYRPAEVARFKADPFVSGDGMTRKLIVETFGGRTWISEYGVMLGLSTHYFAPNQAFLGYLLEGRMRNSLAHALAKQGYGSTYVYPAPRSFANTGRFYGALGFERVLDDTDSRQPSYDKRDRDYYARALNDLKARRDGGSAAPQFTFVMTAATHFPWSTASFPDVRANEIVAGDPWAEFSRRVRIAHDDYTAFKARLAAEFPDEAFLLVGFGDHHPNLTGPLIMDTDPKASPRYETFYRLEGVNMAPAFAAAPDSIEIGYLANVLMAAAKLPLDESFAERRDLMVACAGRLFRCPDQTRVLALHRALVERGEFEPRYALSK